MVEVSLLALRAREVLKWRRVRGEGEVGGGDEDDRRECERVVKERWCARCSALRRAMSYFREEKFVSRFGNFGRFEVEDHYLLFVTGRGNVLAFAFCS
jgi:hypothetical protein